MKQLFFLILIFSFLAPAEQVGLRFDLEKKQMQMIVADSELHDAMNKVVKIMQAAETATVESSPDSFTIKSQRAED